ncbi:MAG: serine/threonine protein kinase [Nocardioides sp.]|nr:serine/threonine protein kinase [Nocardioides sp.]
MPRPTAPRAITIGDYTLLAKLGEGGMGIVHLARKAGGDRVALKVLRPHIVGDDEARARLAREVTSLSRIRSRWVAEILDADPWAPIPYVATRYVPGLSLHDHVVEEGPITGPDLLWFATCLAEGVASVHAAGVLHRDVKPSNVLLEGRTPILIDFGLARVADDPKVTHTGWLLGTPGYLAPEILYGDDATTASDVHSWASTVAYAAMGRPPFGRGPSVAVMDRVRRGEHDLRDTPLAVRALLSAALDPEPARRPSLGQVIARLRDLAANGERCVTQRGGTQRGGTARVASLDPLTLPVGLVDERVGPPPTPPPTPPPPLVLTQVDRPPAPPIWNDPDGWDVHAQWQQHDDTDTDDDPWAEPVTPARPEPRLGVGEKLRRGVLLLAGSAVVGAAAAAYPWPSLAVVVVVVWLLRSGSLAASAAGERRRLRGPRWYDGAQLLLHAPWDLVRSVPVTVLLVLWSGGLAVSAALLSYAAAASQPVALGMIGSAFAVAVWTGPGGSRVRAPLNRVVRPLARPWRSWLVAVVVLVALALGGALVAVQQGTTWMPGDDRPFAGSLG